MSTQRDRKLAELAEKAYGIRHGMAAFDERLDEMGAGPPARGQGRGGKGTVSDPTFGEVDKAAVVVTTKLDGLVDRAHAAVLDLEEAYQEIAQPKHGMPTMGTPNCAWCEDAARAWRVAVAKAEQRGEKVVDDEGVATHRCRPYLFAEVKGTKDRVVKVLVCQFCYRFHRRHGRPPTVDELWLHAQGKRVLVKPGRKPKAKTSMRAAERVAAGGR